MTYKRAHDVRLSELGTFRLGGTAREVVTIETEEELMELFRGMKEGQKWFVLGGGSNVVFPDGDTDTLIIRMAIPGIRALPHGETDVALSVGAGVPWDDVVAYAVEQNLSGIEALSFIPVTTGATPVQNV